MTKNECEEQLEQWRHDHLERAKQLAYERMYATSDEDRKRLEHAFLQEDSQRQAMEYAFSLVSEIDPDAPAEQPVKEPAGSIWIATNKETGELDKQDVCDLKPVTTCGDPHAWEWREYTLTPVQQDKET
jgi:hypothetical protein